MEETVERVLVFCNIQNVRERVTERQFERESGVLSDF